MQVRSSGNTRLLGALLLMWAAAANAQNLAMTSGFSGSWFDPDHSGQGFVVQVLERETGPVALVYFFTYDIDGSPLWLFGLDEIEGNAVDVVLREPVLEDIGDGQGDIPPPELVDWGTLRLSFDDCGSGTAEVLTRQKIQVRSGTLRLSRLAGIAAKSCTGGRSDDVNPEAPAQGFQRFLTGTGLFGVVNYEQRPGEAVLAVGLKKAPDGHYSVAINQREVGRLTVDNGLGELKLYSPDTAGELLLTVNPIGALLTIAGSDGTTLISEMLPDRVRDLDGGGAPPPFGRERIRTTQRLDASDVPFATETGGEEVIAEAELTRREKVVVLDVQLVGAEPTTYDVLVDGRVRGRLGVVSAGAGRTYGRVSFRFPLAPGSEPLTFDPRGSRIEIRQSGTFISGIDAATTVALQMPEQGDVLPATGFERRKTFSR